VAVTGPTDTHFFARYQHAGVFGAHDDATAGVEDIDAVVYDLDGTLVHLAVDWGEVTTAAADRLAQRGLGDRVEGLNLWGLLQLADDRGHRESVEAVIADHEREGARASERLPMADDLPAVADRVPVGVCSLNCEAACRIALETHGLDTRVRSVVGRDSVGTAKPDPEPLLAVLDDLGVGPDDAVFVGDTERDAETARRAGVRFHHVE